MPAHARTLTAVAGLALIAAAVVPAEAAAGASGAPTSAVMAPPQMLSSANTDVGAPALSYTGRYLAYMAIRRDQSPPRQQLRRADLASGRNELLNRSLAGGVAGGNNSLPPVISADGSRVAFTSSASRLIAGDTNGRFDAFVRDAATDTTLLASAAFDGGVANGDTGMASLSKNGRYAVFTSRATDVVPGSTTPNTDVYRRDLANQTTVQVSVRPNGAPSKGPGSLSVDVSADGRLVAFTSYDTDLVAATDTDLEADLFVRNMLTGKTRWLSPDLPAGANPSGVVVSPNGRWVSTRWDDGSLRLTNVSTRTTSMVTSNGYALLGSFSSAMGRFVFVASGRPYVRDLASGVNTPIGTPDGGFVTNVTVSGNGAFAAYDWVPDDGSPSVIFRVPLG